jgi:hypothetical protein
VVTPFKSATRPWPTKWQSSPAFPSKDGEKLSPLPPSPRIRGPVAGKNTKEEDKPIAAASAAKAGEKPGKTTKAAAAKAEKLTDEESEAAITALDEETGPRSDRAQEISDALTEGHHRKEPRHALASRARRNVQDRINKGGAQAQRAVRAPRRRRRVARPGRRSGFGSLVAR